MRDHDVVISAYGVTMPPMIYGTAWKKERTASLVEKAIELGFRGIDTACQPKHYQEAGVGQGVAAALQRGLPREALYLQSKFTSLSGQDPRQIPYDPAAELSEQVAQSFQRSLDNLQTTYLDCLVLHSPFPQWQQTWEVWQAMEDIFARQGVKQLGISNCYDLRYLEKLYQTAKVKPAIVQNRFYAQTDYDRDLREFCRHHGILYQSFWTLTANPGVLSHPIVQTLMQKYRRTAAQIFFRYLTQMQIIPLTGTTSVLHMQEDLAIFDFALTADECHSMDSLL
ncbi:MAG: aldo/keto reductase [Magnetococcales bacterium]|nr:aldo/keto reductase [Magnetococcales bacterium]NGZ25564.1 aldo/keto reductase [Magnetococcales bacterium]